MKTLLLSEKDVEAVFKGQENEALTLVESALLKRRRGEVLLPDKISQIFDVGQQNRINCMPASLLKDKLSGVKWVSVFPENIPQGLQNVQGTIILSELDHGFTKAILGGTYITSTRTAAVGAVAAKHLAGVHVETVGFIGAGHEAMRHLDLIKLACPTLKVCYVSSRRDITLQTFLKMEGKIHPDMKIIPCGDDFRAAVRNADIIVTATSTQSDLLKARWVKEGALYIHVGGYEDEYAVAQKAGKIVCDEWQAVKHRSQTISRMYQEGLLSDADIYGDLGEIISGQKPGRQLEEEFIYFCSVGLAYIDIAFAQYAYEKCVQQGLGTYFDF